jgi:hypothetical protein
MQPFEALRNWRRREEVTATAQQYPPYQHLESHFNAAEIVKDIILGLSGIRLIQADRQRTAPGC